MIKMSSFNRSTSLRRRASNANSPKVVRPSLISQSLRVIVLIGSTVTFLVAIAGGYMYVLPNLGQAFHGYGIFSFNSSDLGCDILDGTWVRDDNYPLYNASECPFVEKGFNCLGNGRKDEDYLQWRWKPKSCEIPRFDVLNILQHFQGKRIVFVGDSMSRTQWESLICLLMTGVEDKSSVYEVNGNTITKRIRYLSVRFSSYNFTVEFFRSVFLVEHNWVLKDVPRRVQSTLRLDRLDVISKEWVNSDVLIFNSGQWWVPGKLFEMGCYFQIRGSLKLGLPIAAAYKVALDTWASWVDRRINKNKTHVFFRTFEPSHWSDKTRRFCNMSQGPAPDTQGRDKSLFTDTVLEVVKTMRVPVTVLHITSMSAFRSDAHVGNWGENISMPDCSHWCLPGLPDMWNEITLSFL